MDEIGQLEAIMKSTCIILKSKQSPTRDVFSGPSARPEIAGATPPDISVSVDQIDRNELAVLNRDRDVIAVAPAMPMKLIAPLDVAGVVEAAAQDVTWGVKAVGADISPFTGEGIVVAVLDTGIDAQHPAFAGVELIQKDFTGEGNGDQHGHGTHCAGTIFGRKVNGTRIGVAPGVKKALIGKVLGQNGGGSSEQIISAILWAVEEGAHVISMSLGMDFPGFVKQLIEVNDFPVELATSRALEGYRANTQLFDTLAAHIRSRGAFTQATLIVAAAGNESKRNINPDFEIAVSPPAVAEGIVSVAALGEGQQGFMVAPFSNTGANVAAPGVAVVSAALGGGLRTLNGTSMATPHVAGIAALWAEKLKGAGRLNAFELTSRVVGSASSEGLKAGFDPFDVGAGLVRAPQS
jgi:subtilisin family serine protease